LFIKGGGDDVVTFTNGSSTATTQPDKALLSLDDGTKYFVYHIGNDELLVQNTISNITVHG
jgi:hypothetical protein